MNKKKKVTDPRKKQQHGIQAFDNEHGDISSDDQRDDDEKDGKSKSRVVLPIKNQTFKKRHTHHSGKSSHSSGSKHSKKSKSRSYDRNDERSPVSIKSKSSKRSHRSRDRVKHKTNGTEINISKSRSPSRRISKLKTKSHAVMNGSDDLIVFRRKSTILSTVNANEEKNSLLAERKLLNLERDELERERQKFMYEKKKHETEVYAVKTEYIEQTKKLKKQYNIYKQTCDELMNDEELIINEEYDIKYHKLETKEKLLKDSQVYVEKKQKTAQILYQTSTNLLQKVQDATMKMEVYAKLCDEKCDTERELIRKQEMDRKRYLSKMNKLRDEMLSAPWLLLSGKADGNNSDPDINKLHKQLIKTYQAIREERRKFLPVQRKWAKVIAKHQVYNHDEKAFLNIRQKLQNMRKYEKEYKMKVFEEMKAMLNGTKMDEKKLEIKVKSTLK